MDSKRIHWTPANCPSEFFWLTSFAAQSTASNSAFGIPPTCLMHLSPAASHTGLPGPLQKAVICYLHTCHSSQAAVCAGRAPSSSSQKNSPNPVPAVTQTPPNYDRQTPNQSPWWLPEDEAKPGKLSKPGEFVKWVDYFSFYFWLSTFSATIWCQKRKYLIPVLFTLDSTPPMIICQRFNCAWKLASNNAQEA